MHLLAYTGVPIYILQVVNSYILAKSTLMDLTTNQKSAEIHTLYEENFSRRKVIVLHDFLVFIFRAGPMC